MRHTMGIALVLAWLGCSGAAPPTPAPEPPPPASAPPAQPATSPCATDADCRLFDGPACSCHVALTSETVTPSQTPCFAPPCMNREAFCDAATHACAIREAAPPPPPATDEAPAPSLDSIAPIS